MRKVFLAFLGTNRYIPCNYFPEYESEKMVSDVKFVQKALIEIYCQEFGPDDQIFIFTTKDAKTKNWLDFGQVNRNKEPLLDYFGLQTTLESMNLPCQFQQVDISDGFSEKEIWQVFQQVFSVLQPEDEVILDITHAFRSLPMLGLSLVNYAKALQNITVKGIYYGAFEKLGPGFEVEKMEIQDRNTPILNLSTFTELQDWTSAAQDFIRYGIPTSLTTLSKNSHTPVSDKLDTILSQIKQLNLDLRTNRGRKILALEHSDLLHDLQHVLEHEEVFEPLAPLIDKMHQKVRPLLASSDPIWLAAVKWCIDHKLIQQGITQLEEGLITFLCDHLAQNPAFTPLLNATTLKGRGLMVDTLNSFKVDELEDKLNRKYKVYYSWAKQQPLVIQVAKIYSPLKKLRNTINHSGYTDNRLASQFEYDLKQSYQKIKTIVNDAS